MSSSSSESPTSPRSSGTTRSVVVVHQTLLQLEPQNKVSTSSKKLLRRQIYSVVQNLESVVSELNSVMQDLQGVLAQIDKVTNYLDARYQSKLSSSQQTIESEKLWTVRKERSVSSGYSLSSRNSKPTSSTSTSSSSSTDLSSVWKIPPKNRSRSTSSGKQSHHRRNRNSDTIQGRRNQNCKTINVQKGRNRLINHKLNADKGQTKSEDVQPRGKSRNTNGAYLRRFCCVSTYSTYSAESETLRSCLSDDGIWVLRKGNGIKSPMSPIYPFAKVPVSIGTRPVEKGQTMQKSLSEDNISSCSSKLRVETVTEIKLPKDYADCFDHTPNRTSGIASLSDGTVKSNASSDLFHNCNNSKPLSIGLLNDEDVLMTYVKSPVSSAQMHRISDLFGETKSDNDAKIQSSQRKRDNFCYKRKPWEGIYQYESETEISQKEANPQTKERNVDTAGSASSVTHSVGATLSEIEPDMVETDYEIEFSLMPTITHNQQRLIDAQEVHHQSNMSSLYQAYSKQHDIPSLRSSFSSLDELEEFKKRYKIDSSESDENIRKPSDSLSIKSRERELVEEGLKLLLYDENDDLSGDISEQKQQIMRELDSLKLSFNSALSTPDSDFTEVNSNHPVDITPVENNLSDVFTLSSSGSSNDSLLSNADEFHSDPEVKAFLQELDKKVLDSDAKQCSNDNISVFSGSKTSHEASGVLFSRKLTQAVLDENSNIRPNSMFRSSMDSVLTDDSNRYRSSEIGDSDHMMESFEWEHSFTFSMYQETGSQIPDFSPDAELTDKTLDSSFSQNFDLDEGLTYSLSYPLEKARSASLSSESFIWSEGSITSDRRLDSTGKSVDELLSELDISTDLLSKSNLKRPETLVPSLDKKNTESSTRSEGMTSDYSVGYNRDINTWTAFAMVHIGGSDSNLSRCSIISDGASPTSTKSINSILPTTGVKPSTAT